MYKFVDNNQDNESINGFLYLNHDHSVEGVFLVAEEEVVIPVVDIAIKNDREYAFRVYVSDIPKLILALKAAQKHLKNEIV